jgi:multiple sugar transport system substrate-binding protein
VKDAWDKKLFPPGVTTWDGAGDNNAYLSGQTAFIANTGSVGIAARARSTRTSTRTRSIRRYRPGPKGTISPTAPERAAIHKSSKNPDAARALLEHLAQAGVPCQAYYADAIYGPVLKNQAEMKVFDGSNPILAGLLDLVQERHRAGAAGRLQHRVRRNVGQFRRAEDDPARRHRWLGPRPLDGRGAEGDAGDLRQAQVTR